MLQLCLDFFQNLNSRNFKALSMPAERHEEFEAWGIIKRYFSRS